MPVHQRNIQYTDATNFEKVLQQGRTLAFECPWSNTGKFRRIIGDENVSATDQLQRQFAFTDAGVAGNQYTGAVYVHHYTVHDLAVRQVLHQEIPQTLLQLAVPKLRLKNRDRLAHGQRYDRGWGR